MLENITRREKLKGTDKQAHPHNFHRNCMLSSLCCSSVMKAEKDASEAIRSGQATILHQAGVECGKIINQQD